MSFVEKSSRKKKTLVHFAVIKTPHFACLKHIRWSTKDVLCCYGPIVLIFENLNSHRHIYIIEYCITAWPLGRRRPMHESVEFFGVSPWSMHYQDLRIQYGVSHVRCTFWEPESAVL